MISMFICIALTIAIIGCVGCFFLKEKGKSILEGNELTAIMLIIIFVVGLISQTMYMIKPSEVGIVVNLFGDSQGVVNKELTTGVHFIPPYKNVYKFPTFEQNHQWVGDNSFQFQTAEGLSVKSEIGITYHLEPTKIHLLFAKYRRGMDEITDLFIRNHLRDAVNNVASKMNIEDLYGEKKELFFQNVYQHLTAELTDLGFIVSKIYMIGKFQVPEIVVEALNKKIEAIQRAQQRENELRETEAQAKKEIAQAEGLGKSMIIAAKARAESMMIEAQANADANALIAKSLTSEIIKWQSVNKWDGKLPHVLSGANTPFLIDIK